MNIFAAARSGRAARRRTLLMAGAAATFAVLAAPAMAAKGYAQTNLVTDSQGVLAASGYAPAAFVDPNLKNPWGIARSPTGAWWVSNADTATETLYSGAGKPSSLEMTLVGNSSVNSRTIWGSTNRPSRSRCRLQSSPRM